MGYHKTMIVRTLSGTNQYMGKCECGAASLWVASEQEADDFLIAHMAQVERAKAALRRRNVTLSDQAGWFRKQADAPGVSQEARALWLQLAVEADTRLGKNAPPTEQMELFSEDEVDRTEHRYVPNHARSEATPERGGGAAQDREAHS